MMNCKKTCVERVLEIVGIVLSILIAAGIGALYAFRLIPGINFALWIALGLGILSLITLIVSGFFVSSTDECNRFTCCIQKFFSLLTTGSIGTIIMVLISLAASISTIFTTATIIFTSITALFLGLLITGIILFLYCIIFKMCC